VFKKIKSQQSDEQREGSYVSLPLEAFKVMLPYLMAMLLIAMAGYWLIDPEPPKEIVISISKNDGNYQAYASLYAVFLQQEGVTLEIRESEGPQQSLAALRNEDAGVDMALIAGGVASQESTDGLVSLGSLYYEPMWIFHKLKQKIESMSELKGKRIAVGRPDSANYILAHILLGAAGVTEKNSKFIEVGDEAAADALQHGLVDVILVSGASTTPLIEEVAAMPGVKIAGLSDAEAYSRQYTFLHHLVLPKGALNLASNIPPQEVHLLAPTVTLVAREAMNQSLVYLMLKVVSRVHGGAGMLQKNHEFPSDKDSDFEMSSQAAHFYESGPPFLDQYLPFWAATFVNRVLIILLPLVAIFIPLSRIAPSVYTWMVKSRIYKLYGELRFLEIKLRNSQGEELPALRKELDAIESKVNSFKLPVAYTRHLYELRSHIELVRSKL